MSTGRALTLSTVLGGVAIIPVFLSGILSAGAQAADRVPDGTARKAHTPAAQKSVPRVSAKKEPGILGRDEAITVFGHGSTRQMTSITHSMMLQSAPGTSPLKVLSQLPGVVY